MSRVWAGRSPGQEQKRTGKKNAIIRNLTYPMKFPSGDATSGLTAGAQFYFSGVDSRAPEGLATAKYP
jgi:hypothetical protein